MSRVLEMLRARSWPRAAALTLMTIGVAACSSDTSRFHESPFGLGSDTTGSVAQGAPQGQPASRVESRPLAPQGAQAQPIQPATKLAAATPGAGSVVRKPGDVVVAMSNGAFGGVHEKLLTALTAARQADGSADR